ncbi:MAG: FliM/FliN family flagellar motor switch protein [Myxococcota bacterium]|nr:FliM/FliN family flagellar motor switch protein [Myxococcota bacterium]
MEPVLTQEELEAIYEAMRVDCSPATAVDDFPLTETFAFVKRAEASWTNAAKTMAGRIETVLSGALGRRTIVEVKGSVALNEDQDDGFQHEADHMAPQGSPIDDASVISAYEFGTAAVLLGMDRTVARKYIERRTGASSDVEDLGTSPEDLTILERRLLRDLMNDIAAVLVTGASHPCTFRFNPTPPEEVWQNRSVSSIWISMRFAIPQINGPGVWLRGPASIFMPAQEDARSTLASRLSRATVVVSAELGKLRLSVSDLWQLKSNAVLATDTTVGDSLKVFIGGIPKLEGEPLVSRGNIAVRIKGRSKEVMR